MVNPAINLVIFRVKGMGMGMAMAMAIRVRMAMAAIAIVRVALLIHLTQTIQNAPPKTYQGMEEAHRLTFHLQTFQAIRLETIQMIRQAPALAFPTLFPVPMKGYRRVYRLIHRPIQNHLMNRLPHL